MTRRKLERQDERQEGEAAQERSPAAPLCRPARDQQRPGQPGQPLKLVQVLDLRRQVAAEGEEQGREGSGGRR